MFLLKVFFCTALTVTAYHWMRQLIVDRFYPSRVCYAVVNPGISVGGNSIPRTPLDKYSDKELIEAVCNNDQQAIVHLFYKKCLPTFQYHIYKLFPYKEDVRDLVDEFFLYLFEDDWRRLRTFDGSKASLATWMSVTSFRFFKSYKHSKIDSNGLISISDKWESFVGDWVQSSDSGLMMDINNAISTITNDRDRQIAKLLFIEDKEFQSVADRFDLSIDYVYTVKNRLVKQLKAKLGSYL